jgi:hypothetical protein
MNREDLHETTQAVIAADEVHLAAASDELLWERRGFAQRLTRPDGPATDWLRRALRRN